MLIFKKNNQSIIRICALLARGEVVAAPTETAFGLLADATNARAVLKAIKLKGRKGRGKSKPLPLVTSDLKQVKKYLKFSATALQLADKFWPGPLTLVLPMRYTFPPQVMKNGWVGARVTSDRWLNRLIRKYGKPLVATSANLAGEPALYNSNAVIKMLSKNGLEYIVAGKLKKVPTSTVAKVERNKVTVLRQGRIKIPNF